MELKAKYDKMILDQTIESFCAYGKELFENEEALETESKSSLIAEFETKCKNNYFSIIYKELFFFFIARLAKKIEVFLFTGLKPR